MKDKYDAFFLDLDHVLVYENRNSSQENFEWPIRFDEKALEEFRKFLTFLSSRVRGSKIFVVSSWRFLRHFDGFLLNAVNNPYFNQIYDNCFSRIEDADNETLEEFIELRYGEIDQWYFIASKRFFGDLKRNDRLIPCTIGFTEGHLKTLKKLLSCRADREEKKKKTVVYDFGEMYRK